VKLLVLGGTRFLGPALVREALSRGHELTLFHRGREARGLFPGVEEVYGDRAEDLGRLGGRSWDAVLDTCGYTPGVVGASARALAGRVGRYVFVSTISVYADFAEPPGEDAPLATLEDPAEAEGEDPRGYGARKALCEREVEAAFEDRALLLRAGLLSGPGDRSDRGTDWSRRLARGGARWPPGDPARPVQTLDVRDLAAFAFAALVAEASGPVNVTGPPGGVPMGELLETCRALGGVDAALTWLPEAAWEHPELGAAARALPVWIPAGWRGFGRVPVARAQALGLRPRPLAETLGDLRAWDLERGEPPLACGPSPAEEAGLIEAYGT